MALTKVPIFVALFCLATGKSDSNVTEPVPLSAGDFAEVMHCDDQSSFQMNGGEWTFVYGGGAPGIMWGDLIASWEKGPDGKRYVAADYTFFHKSFKINDQTAINFDLGATTWPLTLWLQETFQMTFKLPLAKKCNQFWATLGFGGFYVFPWDLASYKSPGFDQAGQPRSLRPNDLVVKDLAWRVKMRPKLKSVMGEKAGDPMALQLRLSVYLELRPIFEEDDPATTSDKPTTSTTLTTTLAPYVRRRRDWKPEPKDVPLIVVEWCELYVFSKRICNIQVRCLADPHWYCLLKCIANGNASAPGLPGYEKIDEGREGTLRSEGWFQRRRRTLKIPSGVIFDTPELESLLSPGEKLRVQRFKNSTNSSRVPPSFISVHPGQCPPLAVVIGGGCMCVGDCSQAAWSQDNRVDFDGWSFSCSKFEDPEKLVPQEAVSICDEGHSWSHGLDYTQVYGKLAQMDGISATCLAGTTLIGGSCNFEKPNDEGRPGKPGFYASYADGNSFICKGQGEMNEQPTRGSTAIAYCMDLKGNEEVKVIRNEGRSKAWAQCPEGYKILGGGCRLLASWSSILLSSYPTVDNTWQCVFDSVEECPPDGKPCELSEAQAICMAIGS